MRKYFIISILILVAMNVYALDANLSLGYQERYTNKIVHAPIYVTIDVSQDIGNLKLYGEYTNEMKKSDDSLWFSPAQDYYMLGVEYDFDAFILRAEHMCMHPVVTASSWDGLQGGYTRFEITLGD